MDPSIQSGFVWHVAREALETHAAVVAWHMSLRWLPRPLSESQDVRQAYWQDALITDPLGEVYTVPLLARVAAVWEALLEWDGDEHFLSLQLRWQIRWRLIKR